MLVWEKIKLEQYANINLKIFIQYISQYFNIYPQICASFNKYVNKSSNFPPKRRGGGGMQKKGKK